MAFSAPRTRSRLSATALSGSPTIAKCGIPDLHLHVDAARLDSFESDRRDTREHAKSPVPGSRLL